MPPSKLRTLSGLFAVALILVATAADARMGGGGTFGSRGMRTYSAPSITRTAPGPASPIQRSITQPGGFQPGPTAAPIGQPGGLFGRGGGFLGGLAGGLLGAGLLGAFFGHGFFGGLSGGFSILGLLLQLGILFFVVRWALGWWQSRSQPSAATAGFGAASYQSQPPEPPRSFSFPGLGSIWPSSSRTQTTDAIPISQADLDTFEELLKETQTAYGKEDVSALRRLVTPEILSELSEELTANASRGIVNRVTDVKLLQGDLAEAWREGDSDYATLAMRYALKDVTEDRESGKLVETGPSEVTEVLTFRRINGGKWLLSAIQQA
jgi:predicted lipid-binding transport protein (Tim44 family)